MFTKKIKIGKEIKGFYVDNNRILIWTGLNDYKSRELICWTNGSERKISTPVDIYTQHIKNSRNFYWANLFEKMGSFKVNKEDFSFIETPMYFIKGDKDNAFIMLREKKKRLCYYDELNDEILWKQNFSSGRIFVTEKYLFCMPDFAYLAHHILYCIHKISGEMVWQHEEDIEVPLVELDRILPKKIRKILGVYNEELLLGIDENNFIALDIHTGELKYKWENLMGKELYRGKEIERPLYSRSVLLDEDNGKMIGIASNIYWEIDLDSRDVKYWDMSKEFEKHNIRWIIKEETIKHGDHIFFKSENSVDGRHLGYKIGAYNCNTRNVDWIYDFHPEGIDLWGTPEISIHNDKLYVLDHIGTLHVFQKEITL